jgi:hypothetical protein
MTPKKSIPRKMSLRETIEEIEAALLYGVLGFSTVLQYVVSIYLNKLRARLAW